MLKAEHPTLALWLMDAPEDILTVFDEVCTCSLCMLVCRAWRGVGYATNKQMPTPERTNPPTHQ